MLTRLFGLLVLLGATSAAPASLTLFPATQVQRLYVAQAVTQPLRISQFVLQMPDTVRSQMLAALARGDIQGPIAVYQLYTGRQAIPQWLRLFELAFSAENRRPGPCIEVARRISLAFQQLGGEPSFLWFTSHGSRYIAFEMRAGEPRSTVQLSDLSLHIAVRLQNRVYDAFTGAANGRVHAPPRDGGGNEDHLHGAEQPGRPMTHGPETTVKVVPLPEEWRGRFVSLIDVLLRIRSEHARGRPLGFFFGGLETTQAVAAFETGYQACCRYQGLEDAWYDAFNHWLFKKERFSEGWLTKYLAACGGDHLKAIQSYLDIVAEFAAQNPAPPQVNAGS